MTSPLRHPGRPGAAALVAFLLIAGLACGPSDPGESDEEPAADAPTEAPGEAGEETPWPEADPADVESVDAVVEALYDTISGPEGEPRDWDRFRSLFHREARMMAVGRAPDRPEAAPLMVMTVDEYIQQSSRMLETVSFYESEIGRTEAAFRNMVQIMSAYEATRSPGEEPFMSGVNGIQLLDSGDRWMILNLYWQASDEAHPIPDELLGR